MVFTANADNNYKQNKPYKNADRRRMVPQQILY